MTAFKVTLSCNLPGFKGTSEDLQAWLDDLLTGAVDSDCLYNLDEGVTNERKKEVNLRVTECVAVGTDDDGPFVVYDSDNQRLEGEYATQEEAKQAVEGALDDRTPREWQVRDGELICEVPGYGDVLGSVKTKAEADREEN